MIKLIFLLLSLIITTEVPAKTYKMAGKFIDFIEKHGVLVDKAHCENDCSALRKLRALKPMKKKSLMEGEKWASSPGSLVCGKGLKGRSVLGKGQDMDMRAFCLFEDGSMLEINSLADYLEKNQLIK